MSVMLRLTEPFRERKYLYGVLGLMLLAFIGVFSYFIVTSGRIITGLKVAGIRIGGLQVSEAAGVLRDRLKPQLGKRVILSYKQRTLSVVPSAIGIEVDLRATLDRAYRYGRTGSIWRRLRTRLSVYRHGKEIEPVFVNNGQTLGSFYRLLDAIFAVEPIRSVVSVNPDGQVTYSPSRIGWEIDHAALTRSLERAVSDRTLNRILIPVKPVVPPLTEKDIPKWGLDQVMGIYSTRFDPTKTDRVHNIATACSAIDNTIVYPGQVFSFNTWVGPRVSEAGYKEAPVVLNGKLVPGIGGGICQASSTLYNAVLLSNLQVIQRFNHTLPSAYVPLGRDATVVYGGIDFIFQNNYQNPILITAKIQSPYLTIAILGRKTGWERISLENRIIETYPYKIREIPDPGLRRGVRKRLQQGQKGYKVELWREIYLESGAVRRELVNTSIYPAQPEEYKVGVKKS